MPERIISDFNSLQRGPRTARSNDKAGTEGRRPILERHTTGNTDEQESRLRTSGHDQNSQ